MIFNLQHHIDQERFKRRCNDLFRKGSKVELTERKVRTDNQNRYLHLLIGYLAIEVGVTIDYAKEIYYKLAANRDTFLRTMQDPISKQMKETLRSSASLTVEEMNLTIERFRNWSAQVAGIYLPSANERGFLDEIEIEIQRNKEYL